MDKIDIKGVHLTELKKIYHPKGNIFHGMKKSDSGFNCFGEAYFSTINYKDIKAWKKHKKMTLNLVVPVGEIKFVLFDEKKNNFFEVKLSLKNYQRLTVPPNIWMGFEGREKGLNLLLNLADMEHDPDEIVRLKLDKINYKW